MHGAARINDVVFVDQSPIGRTTRSNPASYVGAFDAIRELFASAPESKTRGYTAGTFSFNSGNGRCPTCSGNGFEHVEMQFLSDVYLRCPDCNGRRYRDEVLEVKVAGRSIAEMLELTVNEALAFFSGEKDVVARLQAAGGRGPRLPAARAARAHALRRRGAAPEAGGAPGRGGRRLGEDAAQAAGGGGGRGAASPGRQPPARGSSSSTSPRPGLHFEDVAKLLTAFRRLIAAGNSLVVIEHNLDVIRAADWIVDLGPEGGDAGGEVVCAGTPAQMMAMAASHTGRALKDYEAALATAFGEARRCGAAGALRPARPSPPNIVSAPRPRAQPEGHRRRDAARQVHRDHRRLGLGQVHPRLRHPLQRRASGATSSRSTPTRASSCSRPRSPTWTRSSASRPPWPSSSAPAAAARRARWPRRPRSTTSCACSS